ncbi:RnfH family protein [Hahella ganghwensis]|uniref:RnfH family protein n=1 Tax=Hahella ganghwensis TaxID=286420 RepID=UPI0003743839|nr:RnfH family protein [Hahella ganghwensis]
MSELKIRVEVAYALPEKQKILHLDVVPGTTVMDAVKMSGITELFPEIDLGNSKLGIFGKAVTKPDSQELREGDRVEIYRPLKIDPKQARLNRAKKK